MVGIANRGICHYIAMLGTGEQGVADQSPTSERILHIHETNNIVLYIC